MARLVAIKTASYKAKLVGVAAAALDAVAEDVLAPYVYAAPPAPATTALAVNRVLVVVGVEVVVGGDDTSPSFQPPPAAGAPATPNRPYTDPAATVISAQTV